MFDFEKYGGISRIFRLGENNRQISADGNQASQTE